MFASTCESAHEPIDFATHEGRLIECVGEQRCPGEQGTSDSCSWRYKLCVSCAQEGDQVFIRVQSNSLPNHCFNSPLHNPVEIETDWRVEFNADVRTNKYKPSIRETDLGIKGCGSNNSKDSGKKRKVLLVVIDGLRADAFEQADTPNVDELIATSLYTFDARTHLKYTTWSGAGWSSIFRGVDSQKHLVKGNGVINFHTFDCTYKTFLWYLKNTFGLKTTATIAWNELYSHLVEPDALDRFRILLDEDGAYQMADQIEHEDFDIYVWGANDVDESGHDFAFSPENPQYMDAIRKTDQRIG